MSKLYKIGGGVEMRFNDGDITFYSDNGILCPDWPERAGIPRWSVRSIHVAEGTVFLPESVEGWNTTKKKYTMFGGLTNIESLDLSSFDT